MESHIETDAETDAETGGATETDTGIDLELLDTIESELADVAHALSRLEDGTYGSCEVCGQAIGAGGLAERPATRFCPDHLPVG